MRLTETERPRGRRSGREEGRKRGSGKEGRGREAEEQARKREREEEGETKGGRDEGGATIHMSTYAPHSAFKGDCTVPERSSTGDVLLRVRRVKHCLGTFLVVLRVVLTRF